jgi:hypothetical protein
VVDVLAPGNTVALLGEAPTVKVLPVTTGAAAMAHAPVALDQVPCMAKEPVEKATFWAPPTPPVPTHAHKSPFS